MNVVLVTVTGLLYQLCTTVECEKLYSWQVFTQVTQRREKEKTKMRKAECRGINDLSRPTTPKSQILFLTQKFQTKILGFVTTHT